MKIKNPRQIAAIFALLFLAASFSSCNRGYGCPTNFSVNDSLTEVVTTFVSVLAKK